jgi:hypothetical protein
MVAREYIPLTCQRGLVNGNTGTARAGMPGSNRLRLMIEITRVIRVSCCYCM